MQLRRNVGGRAAPGENASGPALQSGSSLMVHAGSNVFRSRGRIAWSVVWCCKDLRTADMARREGWRADEFVGDSSSLETHNLLLHSLEILRAFELNW